MILDRTYSIFEERTQLSFTFYQHYYSVEKLNIFLASHSSDEEVLKTVNRALACDTGGQQQAGTNDLLPMAN